MRLLQQLIDKQDTAEIVRDQIAGILAGEFANQQQLAVAAGKDADDWKARVFLEMTNPIESWIHEDPGSPDFDPTPIINVSFDSETFDGRSGDVKRHQLANGVFNIEVYVHAFSENDPDGGHFPGDETAAKKALAMMRLVRNILMSGRSVYLQLDPLVTHKWPRSINCYQPAIGDRPIEHVRAAQLQLEVKYNEFSPQYQPVELAGIAIDIERDESGEVYCAVDYDYTT